jgi:hypothetical protein
MLNALRGVNPTTPITHVSAHTAAPNDSGSNEVSGGSYARAAIAFNAASGGSMDDSTNGAVINIPAGTTVTHIGFWSASSAGTFLGYADVTDEVFAGAGTYTVTDADLDIT